MCGSVTKEFQMYLFKFVLILHQSHRFATSIASLVNCNLRFLVDCIFPEIKVCKCNYENDIKYTMSPHWKYPSIEFQTLPPCPDCATTSLIEIVGPSLMTYGGNSCRIQPTAEILFDWWTIGMCCWCSKNNTRHSNNLIPISVTKVYWKCSRDAYWKSDILRQIANYKQERVHNEQ